jgi:uncharacterized protein YndB with AHSA1/START domain
MKWIAIGIGGLAGLLLLMVVIGALLPKAHSVSRTATLKIPAERLFAVISDFGATPRWRKDLQVVEVLEPVEGHSRFRERSGHGEMVLRVEEIEPPQRMVVRIEPGLPYGGTWTYQLTRDGAGTRLTITEDGEVYNPLFRFLSRFVFGHTATIDGYLAALETEVERS